MANTGLAPYASSLAGTLLAAREAVMAPIRPVLRASNVTEQQWRVLRVVDDVGAIDPTRLAGLALLHPPSVTRILRELAERGLVQRQEDPSDGRRSVITITDTGSKLMHETAGYTRQMLNEYENRFGAERLATLRRELIELAAAIGDCAPGDLDIFDLKA